MSEKSRIVFGLSQTVNGRCGAPSPCPDSEYVFGASAAMCRYNVDVPGLPLKANVTGRPSAPPLSA